MCLLNRAIGNRTNTQPPEKIEGRHAPKQAMRASIPILQPAKPIFFSLFPLRAAAAGCDAPRFKENKSCVLHSRSARPRVKIKWKLPRPTVYWIIKKRVTFFGMFFHLSPQLVWMGFNLRINEPDGWAVILIPVLICTYPPNKLKSLECIIFDLQLKYIDAFKDVQFKIFSFLMKKFLLTLMLKIFNLSKKECIFVSRNLVWL